MNKNKIYSLCEAIVDITRIGTKDDFKIPNSRAVVALYIEWAEEFEWLHRNIEWGINSPCEYLEAIEYFTAFKMKCYKDERLV